MADARTLTAQNPMGPAAECYSAAALMMSRHAANGCMYHGDVRYGGHADNILDVYCPRENMASKLPVFINIHGGGWSNGYKEWMGLNAAVVTAFPAIYVAVEYRLTGVSKFPDPLHDILAAIAWVHARIGTFGGDADRIFVGGHSAGGHLSALAALRSDLHARFDIPEGAIKGCLPFSGVYDMRPGLFYDTGARHVGAALLANAGDAVEASPIDWVEGNKVPFFVSWGETERSDLIKYGGMAFVDALTRQQGPVEFKIFGSLDHFSMHLDQCREQNGYNQVLRRWMIGA